MPGLPHFVGIIDGFVDGERGIIKQMKAENKKSMVRARMRG